MYLKTKILNDVHFSIVFVSCFKKFKCLGDFLDSVSLLKFAKLRSQLLDVFLNLAQILICHKIILAK